MKFDFAFPLLLKFYISFSFLLWQINSLFQLSFVDISSPSHLRMRLMITRDPKRREVFCLLQNKITSFPFKEQGNE